MNRGWFNTFNTNEKLSEEEFVNIGKCWGMGDAFAKIFARADSQNGVIERIEYYKVMNKFWFEQYGVK